MSDEIKRCPQCGQLIREEFVPDVDIKKNITTGAIAGLIVGAVFDYFYFYIGVITDFFSFMPVTHLIAGILLGALIGWGVGEKRELNAYRRNSKL